MLTVVYFSILLHKLVFLLPQGPLTVSFPESVVTREIWLRANITAYNMSQPTLIL
jgi:hypothetical protein